jgi:hypothetical protein
MKRIIRLTESDLARIVRRVINEDVLADDNVSTEQLSFYVSDFSKGKNLPIQSVSVTERAVNINLQNSYRFDKSEYIILEILNKDTNIPLEIEKAEILNGPELKIDEAYDNNNGPYIFIKIKDVQNIENFTIVVVGNFVGGDLTVNITSKGSSIRESHRRSYKRY